MTELDPLPLEWLDPDPYSANPIRWFRPLVAVHHPNRTITFAKIEIIDAESMISARHRTVSGSSAFRHTQKQEWPSPAGPNLDVCSIEEPGCIR